MRNDICIKIKYKVFQAGMNTEGVCDALSSVGKWIFDGSESAVNAEIRLRSFSAGAFIGVYFLILFSAVIFGKIIL